MFRLNDAVKKINLIQLNNDEEQREKLKEEVRNIVLPIASNLNIRIPILEKRITEQENKLQIAEMN